MKNAKSGTVYFMVQAAAIAAIYVVVTGMIAPIAFGPIQFRISEALCVLPYFTPAAIPGVTIGCFLSNTLFGSAALDIVFGTLATLIGAAGSWALRKNKWMVCVPPVVSNTVIIPWVQRYAYGAEDLIPVMMVTVGIAEILAIGVLGNLLLAALEKYRGIIFGRESAAAYKQ